MYNSRLDQVTGAIQFMQVAKVLKTVTRPPRKNVAVEVAIGLLGVCQELYGTVNESFNLIVGMVLEISTSGFKPCLLYTSPSPRDGLLSRMPSSA